MDIVHTRHADADADADADVQELHLPPSPRRALAWLVRVRVSIHARLLRSGPRECMKIEHIASVLRPRAIAPIFHAFSMRTSELGGLPGQERTWRNTTRRCEWGTRCAGHALGITALGKESRLHDAHAFAIHMYAALGWAPLSRFPIDDGPVRELPAHALPTTGQTRPTGRTS